MRLEKTQATAILIGSGCFFLAHKKNDNFHELNYNNKNEAFHCDLYGDYVPCQCLYGGGMGEAVPQYEQIFIYDRYDGYGRYALP